MKAESSITQLLTLPLMAALLAAINDSSSYYFGGMAGLAPGTTAALAKIYIPKSGQINVGFVTWRAVTAGTNESISVSVRVNNAVDYLIAALGNTDAFKLFSSTRLKIPVMLNDYVEIKIATPAWVTNPANIVLGGFLLME
jgi:hypothetical protein